MRAIIFFIITLLILNACKENKMKNKEVEAAKIKVGRVAVPIEKDSLQEIRDELERIKYGEKREFVNTDYRPPLFDSSDPYIEIDIKDRYDTKTLKIFYPLLPDKAQVGYCDPGDDNEAIALLCWDGTRAWNFLKKFLPEIEKGTSANVRTPEANKVIDRCKKDLIIFLELREEPTLVYFQEVNFKDETLETEVSKAGVKGYKLKLLADDKIFVYHATTRGVSHLVRVEKLNK
ncbi:MAG: hypothetical protein AB1765_12610 [Candidatus Hydrogenedentota bacterium]